MERSLIRLIVAAIDDVYLREIRNNASKAIDMPLVDVLDHLFSHYGSVDEETLEEYDAKVRSMKYHPLDPIVKIYNVIEELERLGRAARNPYSDKQKVQIGLKVIKSTHNFTDGLKEWYQLSAANQTWITFKQHFQNARELLRKLRGEEMTSELVQQANQHSESLREDMRRTEANLINVVREELRDNAQDETPPQAPPPAPAANNITKETQFAVLQVLRDIATQLANLQTNNRNHGNARRRNVFSTITAGAMGNVTILLISAAGRIQDIAMKLQLRTNCEVPQRTVITNEIWRGWMIVH